jgi:vacuolar-type H+-ATPase subunit I/STV1
VNAIPFVALVPKHLKFACRILKGFLFFSFFLSLPPQLSLGLRLLHKIRLNFLEASQQFYFLQGKVVSPTPNSHPGGPGLCIYIPQRQGDYPF